jgi:peptidoglycan/xylan/chitin deacetylase (PgdA/CDA1 family)
MIRVTGTAVLVGVMAGLVYIVPKMWAGPALDGQVVGHSLSIQDTGSSAPVVGVGPLLRVLQVREVGGQKIGVDPFSGQRLAILTGADAANAGSARYVIQKFGYSATATKTLSITFDDGPDPKVTPELLNVLSANKTPATFFVIGKSAAAYPEIVAREVREGHAVGIHTLTHPDIASVPTWREQVELVATNRVLRTITGQQVGFWRMPYQGNDAASQQDTINGLLRAQRLGYTLASYDYDSNDWRYESNALKGDIPLPNLNSGANITMLMHDAGGPIRMRIVEYVKKLIPYAKAHGYTFQTMPQVDPALAAGIHPVKSTMEAPR